MSHKTLDRKRGKKEKVIEMGMRHEVCMTK